MSPAFGRGAPKILPDCLDLTIYGVGAERLRQLGASLSRNHSTHSRMADIGEQLW
jgi:hypothetical protein